MTHNEINIYDSKWESIDSRPIPTWFDQAKFGIFIHWGLYSVPAWGPKRSLVNSTGEAYAEWYGYFMNEENSMINKFHKKTYGEDFKYQDFVSLFKAELFDPDKWAELFLKSGAKYVTLTSKHHDGFCLWPSELSWNWNSVDVGPRRDIVGELTSAVKSKGLKMGLYYSLYEWYRPLYKQDPSRYANVHMIPQMKDLVEKYKPSLLYTDGEWDYESTVWNSCEFLEWLYNESSVKNEILVNDRWGKETRNAHGGYYTTEYGEVYIDKEFDSTSNRKWEETRAVGSSFGYNRNEDLEDYLSEEDLIHLLIDTVSKGGNLHLNIGPCADGTIPVIMQERLLQLGEWLNVNGEAIYGTNRWRVDTDGDMVCYTCKEDVVYAICKKWPDNELVLKSAEINNSKIDVILMGSDRSITAEYKGNKLHISIPKLNQQELPCKYAYVFKMTGVK